MDQITNYLLTVVIFFPLVGALIVALYGRSSDGNSEVVKKIAIGVSVVELLLSLPLVAYKYAEAGYQFQARARWIDAAGLRVDYHVGIDGLSLWLVLLTTLIVPVALLASYASITKRVREYLVLMLVLETGMIGVFCALDMFLFYLFWEVMLI